MSICLKELEESDVRLQVIGDSDIIADSQSKDVLRECGALRGIIAHSIKTAKSRIGT